MSSLPLSVDSDIDRRLLQALVEDVAIEDAIAGSEEAALGILGVFFGGAIAEVGAHLAAEGDLSGIETVLVHELALLVGELDDLELAAIMRVPPPGIKVADVAGLRGALPLVVERAARAVGSGLEKDLAVGRNGGAQRSQGLGDIARPAGDLRTMQIVDGQPAAGVRVRRGFHAIFAIEHGKHDLADVGARGHQRALRNDSGRFSRSRCTIRKISSAERWSCATCTLRVPSRVMQLTKKRAAT